MLLFARLVQLLWVGLLGPALVAAFLLWLVRRLSVGRLLVAWWGQFFALPAPCVRTYLVESEADISYLMSAKINLLVSIIGEIIFVY